MNPASGNRTLSQLEIFSRRPSTTTAKAPSGSGSTDSNRTSGDADPAPGVSRVTSTASLSSRNPLYDGARITPSAVHSRNSISATSFGSTNTALRGSFGTGSNGAVSRRSGASAAASCSSVASVNPVPTRPAKRSLRPDAPASS